MGCVRCAVTRRERAAMSNDFTTKVSTLRRLSFGLGILAATGSTQIVRAEQAAEVRTVLDQLQALTLNYTAIDARHAARVREIERQIDAAFSAIESMASAVKCTEAGMVYIATLNSQLLSSVEFEIASDIGLQHVSFVSGTAIDDLVTAINSIQGTTGVVATVSIENPTMVELSTWFTGAYYFVHVTQHSGKTPLIFASPSGGQGMYSWTDYGCAIGTPVCAQPANAYLSTGYNLDNGGMGSTTLVLQGISGLKIFTFASGTSQVNIVEALNSFLGITGVEAVQCPENTERVHLYSIMVGEPGLVSVMQVGGTPPIIFQEPKGGVATYSAFANGVSRLAGDVNCDRIVDVTDLILVVQNWGECPLPPFVCQADLTNNGNVNIQDLWSVLNNWGAVD